MVSCNNHYYCDTASFQFKKHFHTFRSAFHSTMMESVLPAKTITALLPLFCEHANTQNDTPCYVAYQKTNNFFEPR